MSLSRKPRKARVLRTLEACILYHPRRARLHLLLACLIIKPLRLRHTTSFYASTDTEGTPARDRLLVGPLYHPFFQYSYFFQCDSLLERGGILGVSRGAVFSRVSLCTVQWSMPARMALHDNMIAWEWVARLPAPRRRKA